MEIRVEQPENQPQVEPEVVAEVAVAAVAETAKSELRSEQAAAQATEAAAISVAALDATETVATEAAAAATTQFTNPLEERLSAVEASHREILERLPPKPEPATESVATTEVVVPSETEAVVQEEVRTESDARERHPAVKHLRRMFLGR